MNPTSDEVDVVTLTLNPSLDLSTAVDAIEPWRKLRCDTSQLDPGGGGINVARAVRTLGGHAIAVATLGGHVGSEVAAALTREGIALRRVRTRRGTRQNFAVTERATGQQFRFIQGGEHMSRAEWQRALDATVDEGRAAGCVVASGSVPPGVPDDVYARLAERLAPFAVPVIVDTSGPALHASILARVELVKPSVNELQSLVRRTLVTVADYEGAARELLESGRCSSMVVSLGAEGALIVPRGSPATVVSTPQVEVRSTIGAGDSMVGGIALMLSRHAPLVDAVRVGVAAGTAAVLRSGTALCRADDVAMLEARVTTSCAAAGDRGR